ncbi:MAG: NusG domain II-containing protein [Clostridia bacterium]|nr:NusG domain II-containing protein [Clostridia bacterium]
MKIKDFFKKNDIIIIFAAILAACLLLLFSKNSSEASAQIIADGETLYNINLSDVYNTYTVTLNNGVEIEISHGQISFISSDCMGLDCVNCGKLSKPGDIAVCIPNKTIIKLTGRSSKAPDTVTY